MKNTFLFTFFLFLSSGMLHAQFTAVAGDTVHICGNDSITKTLGGNPTAIGGLPPYTYEWSITPINKYFTTYYASDILTDTTSANPVVNFNYLKEDIFFYLKVTDANGQQQYDTAWVTFSSFDHITAEQHYFITVGDTVPLTNYELDTNNTAFKSAYITPNYGLSNDSCKAPLYATPDTTTWYSLHLNHKYGCVFHWESCFIIHVYPLGITQNHKDLIEVYPNPTSNQITINSPNHPIQSISVFQINGKQLFPQITHNTIDLSPYANGVYVIEVKSNLGSTQYKVLKE